ncbi:hypothetical protein MRB53_021452 [Persea americana]|uniref:Uncharacterized protein n=1 Tax=Persea americana TaxID=3435 RepID=A0ACC2L4E9_PERAE|nr:hypothetical protein MRB53_021452 [Persea americana]
MGMVKQDGCDRYANCGAYGSCDPNRVVECECLNGFEPKTPSEWKLRDWSGGCVRRRSLDCDGKRDVFLRLEHAKLLPDTSSSRVEPGLNLEACKEECLKNCNCTAYASADISEGDRSCLMWHGDLVDLRVYSDGGQDIYTRVAASELDRSANEYSRGLQGKKKLLVTLLTIIAGLLVFVSCGYCWRRKAKGREMNGRHDTVLSDNDIEENGKSSELLLFNVSVIAAATNNFSESNLLGKGGFGPVYKSLRVGETIISAGENFVLGFFSPGNSKNRYVGISYDKTLDQSVVWTTNRENPVGNSSGVLTIIGGNLVLIDGGQNNNIDSGIKPKKPRDWSGGCVRRRRLDCDGKGDGFFRLEHVKLLDTSRSRVEHDLTVAACKECLKNCNCTAYANADISEGGRGCLMWDRDLINLQIYSERGQDIYTSVAASDRAG